MAATFLCRSDVAEKKKAKQWVRMSNYSQLFCEHMGVSNNNGTPKSFIWIGFFHDKPSILGYPYFQLSLFWIVWRCGLNFLNCLKIWRMNETSKVVVSKSIVWKVDDVFTTYFIIVIYFWSTYISYILTLSIDCIIVNMYIGWGYCWNSTQLPVEDEGFLEVMDGFRSQWWILSGFIPGGTRWAPSIVINGVVGYHLRKTHL